MLYLWCCLPSSGSVLRTRVQSCWEPCSVASFPHTRVENMNFVCSFENKVLCLVVDPPQVVLLLGVVFQDVQIIHQFPGISLHSKIVNILDLWAFSGIFFQIFQELKFSPSKYSLFCSWVSWCFKTKQAKARKFSLVTVWNPARFLMPMVFEILWWLPLLRENWFLWC